MVGDIITVNGVELLVLDEIDGNPFVIALNLKQDTKFDTKSNNYAISNLRNITEQWFKEKGFHGILRTIDLITMNGYKEYGTLNTLVAPLTFDEYRKYASILTPHINDCFWLATGWGKREGDGSALVCCVTSNGRPDYNYYNSYLRFAPAFILDKNFIEKNHMDLSRISYEDLVAELARRKPAGR